MITQYTLNAGKSNERIFTSEETLNRLLNTKKQIWNGQNWEDTNENIYYLSSTVQILTSGEVTEKFNTRFFGQTPKGFFMLSGGNVKSSDLNTLNNIIDYLYQNNSKVVNKKTHLPYKTATGAKKYIQSLIK